MTIEIICKVSFISVYSTFSSCVSARVFRVRVCFKLPTKGEMPCKYSKCMREVESVSTRAHFFWASERSLHVSGRVREVERKAKARLKSPQSMTLDSSRPRVQIQCLPLAAYFANSQMVPSGGKKWAVGGVPVPKKRGYSSTHTKT